MWTLFYFGFGFCFGCDFRRHFCCTRYIYLFTIFSLSRNSDSCFCLSLSESRSCLRSNFHSVYQVLRENYVLAHCFVAKFELWIQKKKRKKRSGACIFHKWNGFWSPLSVIESMWNERKRSERCNVCVFIKRSPLFNLYNLSHYRIYVKFYLVLKRAHIQAHHSPHSFCSCLFGRCLAFGRIYCIKYFRIQCNCSKHRNRPGFSWLSNTKFMNKIRVKRGQVWERDA